MKKTLLSLLLVGAIAHTAQAGMFSAVSGMSMKEIKPTASYTIDTAGINPRVYEFKTSTGRECVLVVLTGDQPSSTLQCETPTVKAN